MATASDQPQQQQAAGETDEDLGLTPGEDAFSAAADAVQRAVLAGPKPSEADLLRLYGLYKQATTGNCSAPRPWFWRWQELQKWRAWAALRGTPKQQAMERYADLAGRALAAAGYNEAAAAAPAGGAGGRAAKGGGLGGVAVSRMAALGDDGEARPAAGGGGGREGDQRGAAAGPGSSLHELVSEGDEATLAARLDSGADANARDASGCTPLHFSADRGALWALRLLVARGADLNALDEDGQTALHYAAVCGQREAFAALLEAGADATIADSDGQLPCDVADWKE